MRPILVIALLPVYNRLRKGRQHERIVRAIEMTSETTRRIGGHRVRWIVGIGAVLLATVGAWAGWQYLAEPARILDRAIRHFRGPELPASFASGNGRIEATEYDIAAKRAGRIATVLVAEGDMVHVGEILARMDTQDLEADLREAQAQVTQAREDRRRAVAAITQRESELRGAAAAVAVRQSDLRRADAAIAQRQSDLRRADAAIAQREGELELAHKELQRTQLLFAKDLIARQKLDEDLTRKQTAEAALDQQRAAREAAEGAVVEARAERQTAEAALAQQDAQKQASHATLTAARIDVDYREAAIAAAVARAQRIATEIADSVLKSPIQGRVLYRVAEPGEVLAAGGKVVTVLQLSDVYMTIFLPTEQAGRVIVGSEGRIVLDAAPDLVIPAAVSFVAPRAQFTPKEVETRTEREKLMFRVKVRIDPELLAQHPEKVKTGVPGVAYVRLDPRADWPEHLRVKLPRT
jgi:HlyD family secretion protein